MELVPSVLAASNTSQQGDQNVTDNLLCVNPDGKTTDDALPKNYQEIINPCGYCDIKCIYNAIAIGFVFGVFANILVIARVAKDRKLQDPTFVGIAALAIADLLFLSINLSTSFETVILSLNCSWPSKIIGRPYWIAITIFWFSANGHVALLAILRYLTIAYPLKSTMFLDSRRVIQLSIGVWVLGSILIGIIAGLITHGILVPVKSNKFVLIVWIIVYLMPLIITTILHVLKVCILRISTKDTATASTTHSIKRMSRIVVMVIIMAAVLPLPRFVHNVLRAIEANPFPSPEFAAHMGGIAHLLFLISNFINPFLYSFMSKRFRNSVREMFWCSASSSHVSIVSLESSANLKQTRMASSLSARNLSSSSTDSFVNA